MWVEIVFLWVFVFMDRFNNEIFENWYLMYIDEIIVFDYVCKNIVIFVYKVNKFF